MRELGCYVDTLLPGEEPMVPLDTLGVRAGSLDKRLVLPNIRSCLGRYSVQLFTAYNGITFAKITFIGPGQEDHRDEIQHSP